jgi:arabinosyltransferase C
LTPELRQRVERNYTWWLAGAATFIAFIPAIYALVRAPAGSAYIGFEYNTDDHMVYAAWMRQAMDGHLLMDNRFTTMAQPGLTVHLYFFALGLVARLAGIPLAAAIGRAVFSVLFVFLAQGLVKRLKLGVYGLKLSLALTIFGAGLGFLVWQSFGVAFDKPAPEAISSFLLGGLPIDVWQPEGFVFPSMLTNGLFMVSLCLIVFVFLCFLRAQEDARAVLPGFLAVGVLMNIHSYDVLTVALVMIGFLGATLWRRQATTAWVLRAIAIGAGAILPALWFVHVLSSDAVFQARAATETFSPNFRQVLAGYLIMVVLGLSAAFVRAKAEPSERRRKLRLLGVGLAAGLFIAMAILAGTKGTGFFLSPAAWAVAYSLAIAAVVLAADAEPAWNLLFAWAVVGMVAIYFPGLFQRKLTMGLSVPWAILSAALIEHLVSGSERYRRNLSTALVLIALGASSIRWLFRDMEYVRLNVSNTTRHPVYLSPDERRVIETLNAQKGRNVLLALPGSSTPSFDDAGQKLPDEFQTPLLPDLAPICSGLSGVYTYAGHWSETPDYTRRAGDMYRFFFREPFQSVRQVMTAPERADFINRTGATYALMPSTESFNLFPLVDARQLGEVVYDGPQLRLVKLRRS